MENSFARQQGQESPFSYRTELNDPETFVQLYDRYYPVVRDFLVHRNGHHGSQEDLIQETFLRAWRQIGQFKGESTIKTYLLGIVRNVLNEEISARRKKSIEKVVSFENLFILADRSTSPTSEDSREERGEEIREALSRLPVKQREAFELVYMQGLSATVAAERVGCSPRTFHNRLYRARRFLKQVASSVSSD